jgi:hypothetical protein
MCGNTRVTRQGGFQIGDQVRAVRGPYTTDILGMDLIVSHIDGDGWIDVTRPDGTTAAALLDTELELVGAA